MSEGDIFKPASLTGVSYLGRGGSHQGQGPAEGLLRVSAAEVAQGRVGVLHGAAQFLTQPGFSELALHLEKRHRSSGRSASR